MYDGDELQSAAAVGYLEDHTTRSLNKYANFIIIHIGMRCVAQRGYLNIFITQQEQANGHQLCWVEPAKDLAFASHLLDGEKKKSHKESLCKYVPTSTTQVGRSFRGEEEEAVRDRCGGLSIIYNFITQSWLPCRRNISKILIIWSKQGSGRPGQRQGIPKHLFVAGTTQGRILIHDTGI